MSALEHLGLSREKLLAWATTNPAAAQAALAQQHRLQVGVARKSVNEFIELVGRDEETNGPVVQAPVHHVMQAAMAAHSRLVLWAHVEAGKTTQASVFRPLWLLGKNPNLRIAVISSSAGLATKVAGSVRSYIENSEALHEVWPGLKPGGKWGDSAFTVERSGVGIKEFSFQALGMGSRVLGSRLDLVVLDDVLTWETARSEKLREDYLKWFKANIRGRISRRGQIIAVNTPMHPNDLPHELSRTAGWKSLALPVQDPLTSEPTWPERWPRERIDATAEELGPLEAGRQLFCRALSDDDARFREEWIKRCLARGLNRSMPWQLRTVPEGYRTITGVDLGTRESKTSDLTVLFTICVHPDGSREVLWIESGRWTAPDIVQKIKETHERYDSLVLVESNAAQDFIRQFITRESAIPILPFDTRAKNKLHPIYGVEGLGVEFYNQKWIIPNQGGQVVPEVAYWIAEMLQYRPDAHTGDRLMASWFAREGARHPPRPIRSR